MEIVSARMKVSGVNPYTKINKHEGEIHVVSVAVESSGINLYLKVGANLLSFLEQPSNQIIIKLKNNLEGMGGVVKN